MRFSLVLLTAATGLLLLAARVHAAPLFTSQIPVPVTFGNQTLDVQVRQDHLDKNHFYFEPRVPVLATLTRPDGTNIPRFTLQRFQFTDPKSPTGELIMGGVLQFAVTFGLSPEQIEQIRTYLKKQTGLGIEAGKGIRVEPVPIKSAKVTFYDPSSGLQIGGGAPQGLAPSTLSTEIPFSAKLDRISTDLNESLIGGTGGIPCWFEFKYEVMSEPAGFEIIVKWDEIYDFYEKNEKKREKFRGGWWIFSWDRGTKITDTLTLTEDIRANNSLVVNQTTNEQVTPEILAQYMVPVITNISEEMFGPTPPPGSVDPDNPDQPAEGAEDEDKTNSNQGIDTLDDRTTIRDIERTKSGEETFSFSARHQWTRDGLASGFINLSDIPKELHRELIPDTVTDGDWSQAQFFLPEIVTVKSQGIQNVFLQIKPKGESDDLDERLVTWIPDDKANGGSGKWYRGMPSDQKSRKATPVMSQKWGLEGLRDSDDPKWKEKAVFEIVTTVSYAVGGRPGTIRIGSEEKPAIIPMFEGEAPILNPLQGISMGEINPLILSFGDESPVGLRVVRPEIVTWDGNRIAGGKFTNSADDPIMFPIKQRDDGTVSYDLNMLAITKDGAKKLGQTSDQEILYLDDTIFTDPDWTR